MLDIVDPIAIPLWAITLYAFAMYPLGFMLGSSCSPCCAPADGCGCETGAEFPEFILVEFDGVQQGATGTSGKMLSLVFSSCFGSGASGTVVGPVGYYPEDVGPIQSVSLTNGGSGYAARARVQPTVSVFGNPGQTGTTFTANLEQDEDPCGLAYWKVVSVDFEGSGLGFAQGQTLNFSAVSDNTVIVANPVMVVQVSGTAPVFLGLVTLDGESGSGVEVSIDVALIPLGDGEYRIESVTVIEGGSGYYDLQRLGVDMQLGTYAISGSYLEARTVIEIPELSVSIASENGEGAVLTPETYQAFNSPKRFGVLSLDINSAGTGYAVDDVISITSQEGQESAGTFIVSEVSESGAILSVTVDNPGSFGIDTGVIESITVVAGGRYRGEGGVITGVSVSQFGQGYFYREDFSLEPTIADVTVTVAQQDRRVEEGDPIGAGAQITAIVGGSPDAPDDPFGQIVGLTLDEPGDGYIDIESVRTYCNPARINGIPILMRRVYVSELSSLCRYSPCDRECFGFVNDPGPAGLVGRAPHPAIKFAALEVAYRGQSLPPTVDVSEGGFLAYLTDARALCPNTFVAQEQEEPFLCANLNFTAYPIGEGTGGGSVTISTTDATSCIDAGDLPRGECCSSGFGFGERGTLIFTSQEQCEEINGNWRTDCCGGFCNQDGDPACWGNSLIVEVSFSFADGILEAYDFAYLEDPVTITLSYDFFAQDNGYIKRVSLNGGRPGGYLEARVSGCRVLVQGLAYASEPFFSDPSTFPQINLDAAIYIETEDESQQCPELPLLGLQLPEGARCPTGGVSNTQPIALDTPTNSCIPTDEIIGSMTVTVTLAT